MIVSQTETVAVLSDYFHFGNNHDLISFLLGLFGFSELLTISKMEIVVQLLQYLQQLRINREFRFSMKQMNELVGISDRLLFPNSLDDSCNFCNSHFFQLFPFWKEQLYKIGNPDFSIQQFFLIQNNSYFCMDKP